MTKHKMSCNRVFKRYDMSCERCIELSGGAEPRKGWFTPHPEMHYNDTCDHGSAYLNPGGYCNICGKGRDFS